MLGAEYRPGDVVHGAGAGNAALVGLLEGDAPAAVLAARLPDRARSSSEKPSTSRQQRLAAGGVGDERADGLEALERELRRDLEAGAR